MNKEQKIENFDPSQPGLADATVFGLPFTAEESEIIAMLNSKGKTPIDILSIESGHSFSRLSSILLDLEFRGVIKSLPGKFFEIA